MGKILRWAKINELPQLINVLKGDMSIIGPRPQDQRRFDAFREEDKAEILKVRPGLSGIGAVYFRDEQDLLHKAQGDMIQFYDAVISPYKGQLDCIGISFFRSGEAARPPRLASRMAGRRSIKLRSNFIT